MSKSNSKADHKHKATDLCTSTSWELHRPQMVKQHLQYGRPGFNLWVEMIPGVDMATHSSVFA